MKDKENIVDENFHIHFRELYCFVDRTVLGYTVQTTAK